MGSGQCLAEYTQRGNSAKRPFDSRTVRQYGNSAGGHWVITRHSSLHHSVPIQIPMNLDDTKVHIFGLDEGCGKVVSPPPFSPPWPGIGPLGLA